MIERLVPSGVCAVDTFEDGAEPGDLYPAEAALIANAVDITVRGIRRVRRFSAVLATPVIRRPRRCRCPLTHRQGPSLEAGFARAGRTAGPGTGDRRIRPGRTGPGS